MRGAPKWLQPDVVLAMHEQLLVEHGGLTGLRDKKLLDSALAKPGNLLAYGKPDLVDLASAYACGIIKNHPFFDGNKRTGFLAAFVFLELNGIQFQASEAEVVLKTLAVAAGEMTDVEYAAWIRGNSRHKNRDL